MTTTPIKLFLFFFTAVVFLSSHEAKEILLKNEVIRDANHETLISPGKIFQMGFFELQPNHRYVGIWYYFDPKTIVWVANRDSPISSSSSIVTIQDDGNFVVKDSSTNYFTTNLHSGSGRRTLKLSDTGNAILADESGKHLWSSFAFPTDTFLPGMYMEKTMKIISWKTPNDPGTGSFVFQKDQVFGYNNYTVFTGKSLHWKSGFGLEPNKNLTKIAMAALELLSNSTQKSTSSRLLMNSSGEIQFYSWDSRFSKWVLNWSEPKNYCSRFNVCGPNRSCNVTTNIENDSICNCLPGFELMDDVASSQQICKRTSTICSGNDTSFLGMEIMKIDVTFATFLESRSASECKEKCLGLDCCQAYSYNDVGNPELVRVGVPGGKQGCWIWSSGSYLVDVQVGDGVTGVEVFIRNPISKGKYTFILSSCVNSFIFLYNNKHKRFDFCSSFDLTFNDLKSEKKYSYYKK